MSEYKPMPIDTSDVTLSEEILELTELLAKNTHDVWAVGRYAQGWTYGPERNDEEKTNPCLVEYYDRNTALETLKCIIKLGYTIEKKN